MKDCTTCKYGYEDERLGIPMCHHPKRFSEDCVDFNMHEEKEKPVPNDIEEAAVDIADNLLTKPKDYALSAKADYWNGVHDGVIAGAKWDREQMISALKNDGDLPLEFIDKFHEIDHTAFQNGQANMREQMMKEAVEGIVTTRSMAGNIVTAHVDYRYKDGQKVRIIIVKED